MDEKKERNNKLLDDSSPSLPHLESQLNSRSIPVVPMVLEPIIIEKLVQLINDWFERDNSGV